MLGVDLQGALVATCWIVEVEVDEGVVDLLLDLVLAGHLEPVLDAEVEEEEDPLVA